MLKGVFKYSMICKHVNNTAKNKVISKLTSVCLLAQTKIAWWDHVIVAPELNKRKVFVRGIVYVFIVITAFGGQILPMLYTGAKLEWKKDQKKAKKNIISDIINRTMPSFRPFWTAVECVCSNVLSLITSRHHVNITQIISPNPVSSRYDPPANLWLNKIRPLVNVKPASEATKGQGLESTRW